MRQYNGHFIASTLIIEKHNRVRCPNCGRFIKFDESVDDKGIKCHSWNCEFCWSFSEHYHSKYGESSLRYNDFSKECYCR